MRHSATQLYTEQLTASDLDKIVLLMVHQLLTAGCLCQTGVVHGYRHDICSLTFAPRMAVLAVSCAHA